MKFHQFFVLVTLRYIYKCSVWFKCFGAHRSSYITNLHIFVYHFTHNYSIISVTRTVHMLRLAVIRRKEVYPPPPFPPSSLISTTRWNRTTPVSIRQRYQNNRFQLLISTYGFSILYTHVIYRIRKFRAYFWLVPALLDAGVYFDWPHLHA